MKNYLIIGGSSGIGERACEILAQNGDKVYATYNSTTPSNRNKGINYFKFDVMHDNCNFEHVPEQLDGLVYCPGSINLKPFHRINPEAFSEDYKLQVIGAVKTIQAILPKLKSAKSSSIVLFSTVAVQTGFNFHSMISASKGAIEGLTRALAAEFAPSIRVNCIAPSLTDTPLANRLLNSPEKIEANAQRHPLKRIGSTGDIANAVKYLLNEESAWITGQILKVDGGLSAVRL